LASFKGKEKENPFRGATSEECQGAKGNENGLDTGNECGNTVDGWGGRYQANIKKGLKRGRVKPRFRHLLWEGARGEKGLYPLEATEVTLCIKEREKGSYFRRNRGKCNRVVLGRQTTGPSFWQCYGRKGKVNFYNNEKEK